MPVGRVHRGFSLGVLTVLAAVAVLGLSTAQALASHVQCGDVITEDTRLDSDLIDCEGLTGLVIGADNITLDLNRHVVDGVWGVSGTAVDNSAGHDGVRVEGGTLRQFGTALALTDATDNTVRNVLMSETGGVSAHRVKQSRIESSRIELWGGLTLFDSKDNRVTGNFLDEATSGIAIVYSERNVVRRNSISGEVTGIEIFGSHHNAVVGNSISGRHVCCSDGMRLDGSTHNRVERNRISGFVGHVIRVVEEEGGSNYNRIAHNTLVENQYGVLVVQSHENVFERNLVSATSGVGMLVGNARRSVLRENVVRDNELAGIAVDGEYLFGGLEPSSDTRIEHNRVLRNGVDGIVIGEDVTRSVLSGNRAVENGDDGIDIESSDTTLSANKADRNSDLGIEAVEGVVDGGGNRAFGNGNPLQCLNITCK